MIYERLNIPVLGYHDSKSALQQLVAHSSILYQSYELDWIHKLMEWIGLAKMYDPCTTLLGDSSSGADLMCMSSLPRAVLGKASAQHGPRQNAHAHAEQWVRVEPASS